MNNLAHEAIELFFTLKNPNEIVLVLLLSSCAQVGTAEALQTGRQVLVDMAACHRQNTFILNTALNMFIQCGDVFGAENWFEKMKCNVINYGLMMKGFNEAKLPMKTLNLFEKMKSENVQTDVVTFVLLIDACSQLGIEAVCRSVVEQIPPSMLVNVQIKTALIDMWVGL